MPDLVPNANVLVAVRKACRQ